MHYVVCNFQTSAYYETYCMIDDNADVGECHYLLQFAHQVQLRLCMQCNPNISVKVFKTGLISSRC